MFFNDKKKKPLLPWEDTKPMKMPWEERAEKGRKSSKDNEWVDRDGYDNWFDNYGDYDKEDAW